MIWESSDWKRDLHRMTVRMTRRRTQERWPPASLYGIEKDFFIGFFIIRRLMEARKLSEEVANLDVHVHTYRATGKPVTLMNWHHLDELYDFSSRVKDKVSLRFVCNQLIHSYVFMPMSGQRGRRIQGVAFASDRARRKFLYELGLAETVRVFTRVATDGPCNMTGRYDPASGDWTLRLWSRMPPV